MFNQSSYMIGASFLPIICIQNYKNASHSCRKSRKNCTNTAVFYHHFADMPCLSGSVWPVAGETFCSVHRPSCRRPDMRYCHAEKKDIPSVGKDCLSKNI